MTEKEMEKWLKVFNVEYMSSEESNGEDWDSPIAVKFLPWKSAKVKEMFDQPNKKSLSSKKSQGLRQKRSRVCGVLPSNRKAPANTLKWASS